MANAVVHSGLVQVLNAARNGLFYGIKIRAPHAVLYTLLFGLERVDVLGPRFWARVAMLAANHARSMACFALIYKAIQCGLGTVTALPSASPTMSLLPGFIGGAWIWGVKTPVADQVNLYVFSRTLMTMIHHLAVTGWLPKRTPLMAPYRWFGALVWGFVMWQFEAGQLNSAGRSQVPGVSSMRLSMDYIYKAGDTIQGWYGWAGGAEGTMFLVKNSLWAVTVVVVALHALRTGPGFFFEQLMSITKLPGWLKSHMPVAKDM